MIRTSCSEKYILVLILFVDSLFKYWEVLVNTLSSSVVTDLLLLRIGGL